MRIIGDSIIWVRDFAKDDDKIKFIFDNVRNFIVSGLVIAAGTYQAELIQMMLEKPPWLSPAFKVLYIALDAIFTVVLFIFGIALTVLNIAYAGRQFAAMIPPAPLGVVILLALVYGSITTLVTVTAFSRFFPINQ